MKIVFIDESGQPGGFNNSTQEFNEKSSEYFTLGSFMIDSDDLLNLENSIRDIKLKYGLKPNQEIKWRMSYSKLGLSQADFFDLKRDIISIISKYKNSVICIVMDKKSCYLKPHISDHNDLYATALHLLMERVCMNLNDEKDVPVMFFTDSRKNDKNNKLDKELQISYLRAKNMGTKFVHFPNFSESIVFIDSEYCIGIQLADFCAGIVHRRISYDEDFAYNLLEPAIRTHKGQINGYGIKIYK